MVFLKEFFKKADFEKKSADDEKHAKLPSTELNKDTYFLGLLKQIF